MSVWPELYDVILLIFFSRHITGPFLVSWELFKLSSGWKKKIVTYCNSTVFKYCNRLNKLNCRRKDATN